jgi:phage terminase large subunit-like protein
MGGFFRWLSAARQELLISPRTSARRAARSSKFLRIPDGPSAGQPLILAPWQKQEIYRIYDNPVGTRRAVISTARKNSKTTLCAALLLNHLCGPSARNRPNTRLHSSAQSRDQAALTFD